MTLLIDSIESPIGPFLLASDGAAVCALEFADHEDRLKAALRRWYPGAATAAATDPGGVRAPLRDYFAGDLRALDAIRVRLRGTEFQRKVWAALRRIPAGTTTSYGRLATALEMPRASRAIGLANGANPVSIIVPCHRVVGAGGDLTGYGGGIARKRWLLEHERQWAVYGGQVT
ncbi:MAG TPA: methylated-DNA--[protein]-cysteine S-methyltransferase [Stellaceae bacterium]|nr:methylated-DNA--[protein]-cysteine S-methyltransferase [Stellaceae bacterium]